MATEGETVLKEQFKKPNQDRSIVLDLQIPGKDGLEALKELKAKKNRSFRSAANH